MPATNVASIDVQTIANRAIYCLLSSFTTYVSRHNLYLCKGYDVMLGHNDVTNYIDFSSVSQHYGIGSNILMHKAICLYFFGALQMIVELAANGEGWRGTGEQKFLHISR